MLTDDDRRLLRVAYEEAKAGFDEGGCPIGSVAGAWRARSWRRAGTSGCSRAIRSPMARWMR